MYQNWVENIYYQGYQNGLGPTTSLNNIVGKRNKGRQIQLVKRTRPLNNKFICTQIANAYPIADSS